MAAVRISPATVRWLKTAAGILLSAGCLVYMSKRLAIGWGDARATIEHGNRTFLVVSFLVSLAALFPPVLVWRRLLRSLYGDSVSIRIAFVVLIILNAAKYLPGKLWFVGVIALLANQFKMSKEHFLVAAVLSQFLQFAMAGLLAVLLARGETTPAQIALVILLLGFGLALVHRGPLHDAAAALLRRLRVSWSIPVLPFSETLVCLGLQALTWLGYGLGLYVMIRALAPALPWAALPRIVGGYALSYLIGYASLLAPAGLGVREGALALVLPHDLTPAVRGTAVLGYRICSTLAEVAYTIVGIVLYLVSRRGAGAPTHFDKSARPPRVNG